MIIKNIKSINIKGIYMKKSAFTMIELVMVIVVLGILAALALPRIERDFRQEAAESILSDIRHTQHLALLDNKQSFNDPNWQRTFWKIMFGTCTGTDRFYMIGSDNAPFGGNSGFFTQAESATDPSNGNAMWWTNGTSCSNVVDGTISKRIFISKEYGITNVVSGGGCAANNYLGFDYLGRPHNGFVNSIIPNNASYMSIPCTFTFTMSDNSTFMIRILPETGYAQIVNQNNS